MPKIRIFILCIIFIFSIIFYFTIERKFSYKISNKFINITEKLLPEKIDEIILAKKNGNKWEKLVLKKLNSLWIIDYKYPRPANINKINEVLKSFRNIKGEIRAKKEETLPIFYLTNEQALHIFFKNQNKVIAHFLIGKKGPTFDTCFLRFPLSSEVYLVNKNILTLFKIFSNEPKLPTTQSFLEIFTDWIVLNPKINKVESIKFSLNNYQWEIKFLAQTIFYNSKTFPKKTGIKFLKKFFPIISEKMVNPEVFKNFNFNGYLNVKLKNGPLLTLKILNLNNNLYVRKGPFIYKLTESSKEKILYPFRIFSSIQVQSENDNPHQVEFRKNFDK